MMQFKQLLTIGLLASSVAVNSQTTAPVVYNEPYRPQVHFSPKEHWMNDPNGMVYYKGTYHLFFQYYPEGTVWGPMHWGHATSKDLIHWQEQPIALYPDSLGYIFSGSAVLDVNNTSGFGKKGQAPLVAIFTHHEPKGARAGANNYQTQSIAYSLDEGKTWTKYEGNPVLKNPGSKDFRDPKVSWFEPQKKWIMILATHDRVTFYSSKNLKEWTKESEFGEKLGAHGGVWECPDLFPLSYNGQQHWILVANLNPGGPNGGSATQYFVGQFDGKTFLPYQTDTHWADYGPDEYAGVTWSNTGRRTIFLGWMSNWQYARVVPTIKWRSAMTIPRDLSLEKVGDSYYLASKPVPELKGISQKEIYLKNIVIDNINLTPKIGMLSGPSKLTLSGDQIQSFTLTLSNNLGEKLLIGYDKGSNQYFIDRTNSGKTDFHKEFAKRHLAPRITPKQNLDLTLIIDDASVELFADGGLSVMTEIFFPTKPYSDASIQSPEKINVKQISYSRLNSIWK
ncbi:MAG: glycoside hydrolase family 32 protein [Flavisolibacter sp.]